MVTSVLWASELEGYREARESYRGTRFRVLRGTRSADGAAVVLKTVRSDLPDPALARARLEREHELSARLALPGVLRPLGLLRVDGEVVLVSRDAGLSNLKDWLRRRALTPARFLDMAIELCAVVAAVHERGVVHADVSPLNVVVSDSGSLTLVDFDAAVTGAGSAPGELPAAADGAVAYAYVAPEQTGRMNRSVDARTDLYGLGATFYEMLTGAPPFAGSDPIQLVHALLARAPVPPAQVNPRVPAPLSELVCKLLAKMPEARYQSAAGLLADLQEARAQLTHGGDIAAFELGRADRARELPISETLYGRARERAELGVAWERVRGGAREALLLTGPAGIGKSVLADELGRTAAEGGAWVAHGKFDLKPGGTPYRALAEAARGLATAMLARPESERAALARRLAEIATPVRALLVEVVPELERLLGPQRPTAPGGGGSQAGFAEALTALIGALARVETPMLLFIDDLQRADPASLALLGALAASPALTHVLILAAYRSDEPDAPTALAETERALGAGKAAFRALPLAPLELEALLALVAETLHAARERALPLAELLLRKTAGNPFFTRRLLRDLHARGLIAFDSARAAWIWDAAAIEKVEVSENVVELLVAALRRLPEGTRELLAVAACIGKNARLGLIAAVLGQDPSATAGALAPALREGLVVPLASSASGDPAAAWFGFAHDRVQQAADSLPDASAREALHLRVGRALHAETRGHPSDDRLFAVVDHLSRALDRLTPAEQIELADLSLRAARKARASSAYAPALAYAQSGVALLPADAWRAHHRLAFLLHREAFECAKIAREDAVADDLFARAFAGSETRLEKAELCISRVTAATMNWQASEGITWGREGMRLLGTELPSTDVQRAIADELAAIAKNLSGRSMEQLLAAPMMSDPEALAQVELLSALRILSLDSALHPFFLARIVNLCLSYGNAALAPSNYVGHGVMLILMTGDYRTGFGFGRLGVDLARKLGDAAEECRATAIFSASVDPWFSPLPNSIALARRGRALGIETGLWLWANGCAMVAVMLVFFQGGDLTRALPEIEGAIADASKAKTQATLDALRLFRQAARCLQGLTPRRGQLEDQDFDQRQVLANGDAGMAYLVAIRRLEIAYLLGDVDEARAQEAEATKAGSLVAWGVPLVVEHNFYGSLVRAADGADEARRPGALAAIASNQRQMKTWADNAPDNFRHKYLLVEAEVARLEGRPLEAAELYDQAISAAARGEFVRDGALANELAARFYRRIGRTRIAGLYLATALRLYAQWGGKAKVDALEEEFPDQLAADLPAPRASAEPSGPALDHLTLYRAAEAIAGELGRGRLVGKLTEVCLASAGAERGVFLLEEDDQPVVRAIARMDQPAQLTRTPLAEADQLPVRVVEEVRRTGAMLVLADACRQGEFQRDPYIAQHQVRSVLVLPIQRQAKLIGIVYLENNLATRLFTPDRVRLLQLLSAQIAISLESSRNFEALTREVDERKRAESKVRFLAEASAALAQSLDHPSTLARVARLALPFLADWCLVDLLEEGVLRRVAAAHHDPAKERLLHEMRERQAAHGPPRYADLTERETPILASELSSTLAAHVKDPEVYSLLRQIGAASSITVPLRARGRPIGLLILVSGSSERTYGPDDIALAQELGHRAAAAIDNARLYRESQEAVRVRDEFLSVASHELRTPLAALLLSLHSMAESPGAEADAAETARLVALAERQGQRLARLVDDLLDTVCIERGVLPINPQSVSLATVVREAVARFGPPLARAGCTARLELDPTVIGRWDPARLEQVVLNLLSNAAKFAPGQEVEVRVAREDGTARLTVTDHGIGIDPARHAHIFDRFERAVSAQHYGGLGLGLFICRSIVEAHRGRIEVKSELGRGATFIVTLPLEDGRGVEATPPSIRATAT